MAVIPSVLQRTRFGAQSVIGTSVPATKRMPSLMSAAWPVFETTGYRSQGDKVEGTSVLNKQFSGFKFEGNGTYNELPYIFASLLGKTGMGPAGGIWTFHPQIDTGDTPQLLSIEHGQDSECGQIEGGVIAATTFSWTRAELKVSGTGFGRIYTPSAAPTSTNTRIGNTPMAANQIQLAVGNSYPASTTLRSAYTWDMTISGRWGPDWVLDSSLTTWKDVVELVPTIELKMKLQRDSDSDAFITQMATNATRHLQVIATGPTGYSMTINMPFVAKQVSEPEDLAGVYVCEWTLHPIADSGFLAATSNSFMEVILQNTLGAL